MFAKIRCIDFTSDVETIELCLFRGIRYDRRNSCVVLSTEHDRHDYIFPIDYSQYERLVGEIEQAIRSNAPHIVFEDGKVFRCRKGELRREAPQNNMKIKL